MKMVYCIVLAVSFVCSPAIAKILTVTARKGDTVYSLARKHGVAAQSIISRNRLKSPYKLLVGQKIRINTDDDTVVKPPKKVVVRPPIRVTKPSSSLSAYKVMRGDSLYSISKKFSVTPKELMAHNKLSKTTLYIGQRLKVPKPSVQAAPQSEQKPRQQTGRPEQRAGGAFMWPVKGKVLQSYGTVSRGQNNDGINIAAKFGENVRAAENGVVVYADAGLKTFGNLVLIKHADSFITAYGHNDKLLVKKGDNVKKGQAIALAGSSGGVDAPQVHFEIRKGVKSVNPTHYLSN